MHKSWAFLVKIPIFSVNVTGQSTSSRHNLLPCVTVTGQITLSRPNLMPGDCHIHPLDGLTAYTASTSSPAQGAFMYYAVVLLLMLIFPLASIGLETLVFHGPLVLPLVVAKWFVFWAVGVRLFTAGLRQAIDPDFTATQIFAFKTSEPVMIIRELGFANIALGTAALLSMLNPAWLIPAAIAGCLFYGLAGFNHLVKSHRNPTENLALFSDLFVFSILLLCQVAYVTHR
jgi:hypothetical protein